MHSDDRRDFAAAHALLRATLSHLAPRPPQDWTFTRAPGGKPHLTDDHGTSLTFNLSHTRGLVACTVADAAPEGVGIDVERVHRSPMSDWSAVIRRYFSDAEQQQLLSCAPDERTSRFIECWTLKEAYIKAVGDGLAHPLETFGFVWHADSDLHFMPPPGTDNDAWTFALYAPSLHHRMAVAVPASAEGWHLDAHDATHSSSREDMPLAPLRVTRG